MLCYPTKHLSHEEVSGLHSTLYIIKMVFDVTSREVDQKFFRVECWHSWLSIIMNREQSLLAVGLFEASLVHISNSFLVALLKDSSETGNSQSTQSRCSDL